MELRVDGGSPNLLCGFHNRFWCHAGRVYAFYYRQPTLRKVAVHAETRTGKNEDFLSSISPRLRLSRKQKTRIDVKL